MRHQDPRGALAVLGIGVAHAPGRPASSLGLTIHCADVDIAAPESESTDDDVTRAHRAADGDRRVVDTRLHECASRLRDRLASVRPAMARLRDALASHRATDPRVRELVALGAADVDRALTLARRSIRALAAELGDLEREARDLVASALQRTNAGHERDP